MTLLDATTLLRVKYAMQQSSPSGSDEPMDTMLSSLITAVSQSIEDFLDLPLKREAKTEVHSPGPFCSSLWLKTYFGAAMTAPTITSVKQRSDAFTDWDDITAESSDDYTLSTDQPGLLLYNGTLYSGQDTVQIVLVASGFANTTNGSGVSLVTDFPAIVDAAEKQIIYEYTRRNELGRVASNVDGSTVTLQDPVTLLPAVRERLMPYKRLVMP